MDSGGRAALRLTKRLARPDRRDIVRRMSSGSTRRLRGHARPKKADSSRTLPRGSGFDGAALAVQRAPQREAALLREHQLLLSKIKQKRGERVRLAERIQAAMASGQRDGLPLFEELAALDRQVHALFAELLARQKKPRQTQKIVREVYELLQDLGQLSPAWAMPQSPSDSDQKTDEPRGHDWQPSSEHEAPPRQTGGATAKRPGNQAGAQSLRGLFYRLADALHPDKVQEAERKAQRTEVMKELTQAYQAGDLARLIELERAWLLGVHGEARREAAIDSDSPERRCAELETRNRALRQQLEEEKAALRTLRRSPQGEFLAELRRMAPGKTGVRDFVDAWLHALRQQRDGLRELLSFVRSYCEGQIDIETFQRGPRPDATDSEDELDDFDLVLGEVLDALTRRPRPPASRGRSRGQRPRRSEQGDWF